MELYVVAIDWSGRAKRASEAIWMACASGGRLVELENGRNRDEVINEVIARKDRESRVAVGLDFAFSFPRWYCEREGWSSARDVWRAMHQRGEEMLAACEPPLWGRSGRGAQTQGASLRQTETGFGAKSVFQIGGAGAVGTGSIRGMPYLLRLAQAGFSIWPFDAPTLPIVVEIYPRLLTGKVDKGRQRCRRAYLEEHFAQQDGVLRERAAGSEDAFDAAVSAIMMSRHARELERLPMLARDSPEATEGAIWAPDEAALRALAPVEKPR
ncbi:MAG TPA: hypothetical protein VF526_17295 [Solirubrobacteraceae bacterium]